MAAGRCFIDRAWAGTFFLFRLGGVVSGVFRFRGVWIFLRQNFHERKLGMTAFDIFLLLKKDMHPSLSFSSPPHSSTVHLDGSTALQNGAYV